MRIILLTPVYPSKNAPEGSTMVVHYFTKEWVKQGNQVKVFNIETKYPIIIYWINRLFETILNNLLGHLVATRKPIEYDECIEGVEVSHVLIKKNSPVSRFRRKHINNLAQTIIQYCHDAGAPDLFIGHWDDPQLYLLNILKQHFPSTKNAIVLHSLKRKLDKYYPHMDILFNNIDIVGFRNQTALMEFKKTYFTPSRSFIAMSGVSNMFIEKNVSKSFDDGARNFVFVGSLIKRKHPLEVLLAVSEVYGSDQYSLCYIGEGKESHSIKKSSNRLKDGGRVVLLGRIDRLRVADHLNRADVFVMISDNETFGLVYLEAMSMGCITIASRGGGVDGIIVDGENGFLCLPGNTRDLVNVISRIRRMPKDRLMQISNNAIVTARKYSDSNVAQSYLNSITSC